MTPRSITRNNSGGNEKARAPPKPFYRGFLQWRSKMGRFRKTRETRLGPFYLVKPVSGKVGQIAKNGPLEL